MRTINTGAKIEVDDQKCGIISVFVQDKLMDLAREQRDSDSLLAKHVYSRLLYFGFAVSSIVTRIVDFVIGLLAAVASVLTLGKVKVLNTTAYNGLNVASVINDIHFGLMRTINPWAATR